MMYRGHVENGKITLDDSVVLPEGSTVTVELTAEPIAPAPRQSDVGAAPQPTVWEELLKFAGTVEGPEDWARNHNHYIHGTPKLP